MQNTRTKRVVTMAMLAAVAYIVVLLAHLVPIFAFMPSVPFLRYDPKDVIIAIGGFILGPLEALAIAVVVSLVEMVTISTTGPIGLVMNVISTAAFACTAAVIYKKKHTMGGAVLGLVAGCLLMTIVMLLWNYLITPLYMHVDRAVIVKMLLPAFAPFNLIKAAVNAALTLLIYKPVVQALRRANLVAASSQNGSGAKRRHLSPGIAILAVVILVTCILLVLVLNGIL